MTNELLILRHGKSDWSVDADDFSRPLKNRGKRGAQRMGAWLKTQGLVPDYVLSSPAERALVTAEKCCKVMGLRVDDIHTEPRIYETDVATLLGVLQETPEQVRRLMLVGHNPGLESLLQSLSVDPVPQTSDGKLLPTATLAHLTFEQGWKQLQPGVAKLEQIVRPGDIPKLFPVIGENGLEYRKRPAYYYTQSGVLPYRFENGQLQILLVGSSSLKSWVFPKGIAEPGYSLAESAAREALEEAGVEGVVDEIPLGQFDYDKWGARCQLTVFAMKVTRVVDEEEWDEQHRGREWLTPPQALQRLNFASAKLLIKNLKYQKDT